MVSVLSGPFFPAQGGDSAGKPLSAICCLALQPALSQGTRLSSSLMLCCLALKLLGKVGALCTILTISVLWFASIVFALFLLDLISLGCHPWPSMSRTCNHNLPQPRLDYVPSPWRTGLELSLILSLPFSAPNPISISITTRVISSSSACLTEWWHKWGYVSPLQMENLCISFQEAKFRRENKAFGV